MDDRRLEDEALNKLLDTIREKLSSFQEGSSHEEMSKPESEETPEDEAEESPEVQAQEDEEGTEEHEGSDPFRDFMEGKSDKPNFMPKGKMAGMSASIEIKKKPMMGRK
jgi:hypothetical protein